MVQNELNTELEDRSNGRWWPNPGTMYPALESDDDAPAPWDEGASGGRGDLRSSVAESMGQVRQIGRFGTTTQIVSARSLLRAPNLGSLRCSVG